MVREDYYSQAIAEYSTFGEWQKKILGDAKSLPNVDALEDAIALWRIGAEQIVQTAQDRGVPDVPWWFSGLTYLLAAVCDLGPGTIDPSPLTTFCRLAMDDAFADALEGAMGDCMGVHNRMVLAFASPEPPVDDETTLDARAAAAKFLHPEWSDQQIANEIGCRRTTLFKPNMFAYKRAKEALKERREEFRGGRLK